MDYLRYTPDDANGDERADDPDKFGGVGDPDDPASEVDGGPPDEREPNRARPEDDAQEPGPRILKGAGGGDVGSEGKGRRSQTGNHESDSGVFLHTLLQEIQSRGLDQTLEALFAALPANQIQEEDADGGSDGRGQDVDGKAAVIPGDQDHG